MTRSAFGFLAFALLAGGCAQILGAYEDYRLGEQGGAGPGGGGGTGGGDGGTAGNGGGGMDCGAAPTPPGGTCPAECNGGCDGDVCTIDCTTADCTTDLVCPADFACAITCGAMDCRDIAITCPADYACSVSCDGTQACRGATLTCGSGPCSVTCGAGCDMFAVTCGADACAATCSGNEMPTLTCGESCSCEECI